MTKSPHFRGVVWPRSPVAGHHRCLVIGMLVSDEAVFDPAVDDVALDGAAPGLAEALLSASVDERAPVIGDASVVLSCLTRIRSRDQEHPPASVYAIEHPRSEKAERAIRAASDFIGGREPGQPTTQQKIEADLHRHLTELDPFWIRWRYLVERKKQGTQPRFAKVPFGLCTKLIRDGFDGLWGVSYWVRRDVPYDVHPEWGDRVQIGGARGVVAAAHFYPAGGNDCRVVIFSIQQGKLDKDVDGKALYLLVPEIGGDNGD